jgi:large subunit ribosomal protein L4
MAEIKIYAKDGKESGKHKLSDKLTALAASHTAVHRSVVAEEANKRQGTQNAKTRSEVRGGGKKPYKQKKTGNARQGTIRAPHYAHGGMALAVKPRGYDKKVNIKERRAAILTAFAAQLEAGNVSVVDQIAFEAPKTKDASALLKAIGVHESRRVLVVLPAYDEVTYKSFRNLPNVVVRTAPGSGDAKTAAFSTRDVLIAHKIVMAKDALTKMEEVWAK